MARKFIHINDKGASKPESLEALMRVADDRIQKGEGAFTLTVDGLPVGQPHKRVDALAILRRRLDIGSVGPVFRVRGPDDVEFACREVKAAVDVINTSGNKKADLYWSLVKAEFPNVTFLGSLVCKPSSQHRFGNAVDVGFGSQAMGEDIWDFSLDNRAKYNLRNLIVQKKIWHLGEVSAYGGVPHVTHNHADFDETFDTSLPCGLRG